MTDPLALWKVFLLTPEILKSMTLFRTFTHICIVLAGCFLVSSYRRMMSFVTGLKKHQQEILIHTCLETFGSSSIYFCSAGTTVLKAALTLKKRNTQYGLA